MKNLEPKHWAVIAGLLTGVATQLLTVQHGWADIATPGFVAGVLIQVATVISAIFVGAPGATQALEKAQADSIDPKRFIGTGAILLAAVLAGGCASVRQVAIQADLSFATAVAAIDDAEWATYQACLPAPACLARHARLNPPIAKALRDVKALTLSIKAVPTGVPSSLPDLLNDMQAIRVALSELDVILPGVSSATSAAETKALALLSQLAGGR